MACLVSIFRHRKYSRSGLKFFVFAEISLVSMFALCLTLLYSAGQSEWCWQRCCIIRLPVLHVERTTIAVSDHLQQPAIPSIQFLNANGVDTVSPSSSKGRSWFGAQEIQRLCTTAHPTTLRCLRRVCVFSVALLEHTTTQQSGRHACH